MYGSFVSCIRKMLLMRIFRNRPLIEIFRTQVTIAHLPRRLCQGPNESPPFPNGYLARIGSKLRSERTSSKPAVFYTRIVQKVMQSGSQEASISKKLPGSLEDLGSFQAILNFLAPNAFTTHEVKDTIDTFISSFCSC